MKACRDCLYFADGYCYLWNGCVDEDEVCPAFINKTRRDVSR